MFCFEASESESAAQIRENGRAGAELCIDLQQPSQRRELNFFNIARAVKRAIPSR